MTDIKFTNLEDLFDVFLIDSSRSVALGMLSIYGDQTQHVRLADILYGPGVQQTRSAREIRLRDAIDTLISFYGLLEIATLIDYIPDPLPALVASEAKQRLENLALRSYYESHCPSLLAVLFRERLSGTWRTKEPKKDARTISLFQSLLSLHRRVRMDEALHAFLGIATSSECDRPTLADIYLTLRKPNEFFERITRERESQDTLDIALIGFQRCLAFCEELDRLIQRAAGHVYLPSAMWHSFGLWLGSSGERLQRCLPKAVREFLAWEPDGENSALRAQGASERDQFVSRMLAIAHRLTSGEYGKPLTEEFEKVFGPGLAKSQVRDDARSDAGDRNVSDAAPGRLMQATPAASGVELPIYMDNHSTTQLDPRVLEAMMPYLTTVFGNAASRNHSFGWEAETAVEKAREQVATLIGATAKEIIFTSGATESNNLAIKGIAEMYCERGNHIVTQVTEHRATLDTCRRLEKSGYRVTYLPVAADGLVDIDDLKRALDDKAILVTIMIANNEIGVIQPVAEIGKLCHEKGVLFHTDGVQALGRIPVNVNAMHIDVMSISAHKIYGPKGVGALYVRRRNPRVQISEQINGGGHERGMRSGTLNVPGIVGLGKACEIAREEMESEAKRLSELRDRLKANLETGLGYLHVNGSMEHRLPGNLNISFAYVEGESLLMGINDVAVSGGSASISAMLEPSYVLKALGLGDDVAHSSIRFGLGRFNTEAEVDYVADKVIKVVQKLRELSPLYELAKEGIDLPKFNLELKTDRES